MNWYEQMAVGVVLSILRQVIKNPKKKEALKATLLDIRDQISAAYPGE